MHPDRQRRNWTEAQRLDALDRYGILDTEREEAFDDIVQLASTLLNAPIAAVNLIAQGRQWFKSEIGLGIREMPLDDSICALAILEPGGMVVPDMASDARFRCNPLVTGEPGLRFYAGELLETADGHPIGTLCVLDTKPRPEGLTPQQRLLLRTLAHQVMAQFELRRVVREQGKTIEQYRRAQAELTIERDRSQQLLQGMDEGFIFLEPDFRVRQINPGGMRFENRPVSEIIGRSHWELWPGSENSTIGDAYKHAMKERVAINLEHWYVFPDGRSYWIDVRVFPVEDGLAVFYRDINERMAGEQALRASEQRLRFVMDSMPQKVFTATPAGEVDYFNPVWMAYTGLSFEQIRDWGWTQFVHPDDVQENIRVWKTALAAGEPFEFENRFRDAMGEFRWHLSRAVPMRDEAGKVLMWIGSNTDIHAIKAAEVKLADLLEKEKRNAGLLENVAAAALTINAVLSTSGIAQVVVDEARNLLGTHRAVISLAHEADSSQSVTSISQSEKFANDAGHEETGAGPGIVAAVCSTNKPIRLTQQELEHHRASAGLGMHASIRGLLAVPLIGHGGKNLGLIQASDKFDGEFTEQDEAILVQLAAIASVGIENARLYDTLKEQDRHKDEFLATLAHELRNPLAPIRTGLDVLNLSDSAPRASQIRTMMARQLTHLVRLVDDLMDVSRVSQGKIELKRERVSLRTIIETALETSLPLIEASRHRLAVSPIDASLFVHGDLTRLAQAVANVINNAAKYSPQGSAIDISGLRQDKDVAIRVRDTGVGISRDMLPKVFDLFTQVGHSMDRSQGGLGIGLSLVRKLVEIHGGSVVADSAGLGKGSTFTIRLPVLQETAFAAVVQDAADSGQYRPVRQRQVVVVDDNKDAALSLSMLLEHIGHDVRLFETGQEAVRAARDAPPDLVFLDIGLPGMSGYEVAAAFRLDPVLKDTILVALTGWGSEEDRRLSREAGFDHHLIKPVDIATVSGVLQRFLSPDR